MIQFKTAGRDRADARRRPGGRPARSRRCGPRSRPGSRTARPRRASPRTCIRARRRGAVVPRLPRLPGDDLRLGQRARSCTASRAPSAGAARGRHISIDCGAILDGWHGDARSPSRSARSAAELPQLLEVAEDVAVGRARPRRGRRRRAGSPTSAHAVEDVDHAEARPYGIVDDYGGHGIGTEMHQDPHVLNYGRPGRGPRLVPGWRWPSSRWSPSATPAHRRARRRLDGRHQGRLARRRTSSTRSRSPRTGPGCSPPTTAASPAWRRSGSPPA